MKRVLPVLLLFLSVCLLVSSQQDPQFSMYRFNGLYLNPAYTGSHDAISATAMYRTQWLNIPGAPQTATVAVHSPFKQDRVALGAVYTYDQAGVTKTNTLDVSFAYRIPIGRKKDIRLCFGVAAGFQNYRTDMNSVATTDPNDPGFVGNSQNLWLPDASFGTYIYSQRFFAGASINHLLTNRLTGTSYPFQQSSDIARQYYNINVNAGYVVIVSEKVKFIPSVLVKFIPAHAPVSFDFNANFVFIDRISFGVGYRLNDSYNFMLAANVTKTLRIGYCYDLVVSDLRSQTSGSHEIVLGVDFAAIAGKLHNPKSIIWF